MVVRVFNPRLGAEAEAKAEALVTQAGKLHLLCSCYTQKPKPAPLYLPFLSSAYRNHESG